jgi:hypothetical protein
VNKLAEIVAGRPDLYPLSLDMNKGLVHFVLMSRSAYKTAVFLDTSMQVTSDTYTVSLDELLMCAREIEAQASAANYICHFAFCCSTLLARYLEVVPNTFVLKEPLLLSQISAALPGRSDALNGEQLESQLAHWHELLAAGLRLLTRTFIPGESVIIKSKLLCNLIADSLLADARSRMIVLRTGLRPFVLSVLKAKARRAWARMLLNEFRNHARAFMVFENVNIESLSDSETAAALWLVNDAICQRLTRTIGPARLLVFDGDQVADDPEGTLQRVTSFFGLALSDCKEEVLQTLPVRGHSKSTHPAARLYDSSWRREDLAKANLQFGPEADHAIAWSRDNKLQLEKV